MVLPASVWICKVESETGTHRVLFVNYTWFHLPAVPVEMPIGLKHLESDFCWCDPVIEVDEYGTESVLHKQVSWH
jgi:hypothetical protein